MEIKTYTKNEHPSNCMVVVGGSGDSINKFSQFLEKLSKTLDDYVICMFDFTRSDNESILDAQSRELTSVFKDLINKNKFEKIDIFCTSMGAYATVKILSNSKYSKVIKKVIFFDPADYYILQKLHQNENNTWSGHQTYYPSSKVISDELRNIPSNIKVDVVHLTIHNYSSSGYFTKNLTERNIDQNNGFPRLSTKMVKAFYEKLPNKNKGKYLEISNLPHGFIRDGNIEENIKKVVSVVNKLLN